MLHTTSYRLRLLFLSISILTCTPLRAQVVEEISPSILFSMMTFVQGWHARQEFYGKKGSIDECAKLIPNDDTLFISDGKLDQRIFLNATAVTLRKTKRSCSSITKVENVDEDTENKLIRVTCVDGKYLIEIGQNASITP